MRLAAGLVISSELTILLLLLLLSLLLLLWLLLLVLLSPLELLFECQTNNYTLIHIRVKT